jgi:hypothetical protein
MAPGVVALDVLAEGGGTSSEAFICSSFKILLVRRSMIAIKTAFSRAMAVLLCPI